ncbi:MAG: c-type cytochrome [Rhodopila sp.]
MNSRHKCFLCLGNFQSVSTSLNLLANHYRSAARSQGADLDSKRGTLEVIKSKIAVAAFILFAGAGVAQAQTPDPIALRQATFDLNSGTFTLARTIVANKLDVKPIENPARGMAKWAALIPSMFPKGSDKGDTKALPEIWSDPAGFKKAADEFGAASTKLADAAKAGDADAVAVATKAVGDACGACHKAFRAK